MTERLYHEDASLRRFDARILRVIEDVQTAGAAFLHTHRPGVVLDRTAFFPTGGGQPSDRGSLAGVGVLEVLELDAAQVRGEEEGDEDGDATSRGRVVVHVVERLNDGLAEGASVEGVVDSVRRLDHTQQHSGQHVLSRAFEETAGAETVSFHLGGSECSIDLDRVDLDAAAILEAERRANEVIQENRPVTVRVVTPEQLATLADEVGGVELRKPPPDVVVTGGKIRLITVDGFDTNPCCGTHVERTGELGLVKVIGAERTRGRTRVRFVAGRRANRDYAERVRVVNDVAAFLSVGLEQVSDQVRKIHADLRRSEREKKRLEDELFPRLARAWLDEAKPIERGPFQGWRVVVGEISWGDGTTLGRLAETLHVLGKESGGRLVTLLGQDDGGGRVGVLFMRRPAGPDGPDVSDLVQAAAQTLGGRGGGKPDRAQASGTNREKLAGVLEEARRSIVEA